MTDDYMPDPERSVAYKLLDPGFTKVFAFGTVFGQIGYIIADSWEDAYEELLDHAYRVDGECDHGLDPELAALVAEAQRITDEKGRLGRSAQDAWEACWTWVDEHCDCEQSSNGPVYMVDQWWLSNGERGLSITPLELVTALRAHLPTYEVATDQIDLHVDWFSPEPEDDDD